MSCCQDFADKKKQEIIIYYPQESDYYFYSYQIEYCPFCGTKIETREENNDRAKKT